MRCNPLHIKEIISIAIGGEYIGIGSGNKGIGREISWSKNGYITTPYTIDEATNEVLWDLFIPYGEELEKNINEKRLIDTSRKCVSTLAQLQSCIKDI